MNFLNRLKYYLIGVGLGILLVLAIFKDRNVTSWTPQNRVLRRIQAQPLELNDTASCLLSCIGQDTVYVKSILENADVNFDKSDVRNGQKSYVIEVADSTIISMVVTILEKSNRIDAMKVVEIDCSCD